MLAFAPRAGEFSCDIVARMHSEPREVSATLLVNETPMSVRRHGNIWHGFFPR